MRFYLHPQDRDGLPVEVILSADEAEQWVSDLLRGVRSVREGQGEQLLLLGEPARIVVTVNEDQPASESREEMPILDTFPPPVLAGEPFRRIEAFFAVGRAGFVIMMSLIATAVAMAALSRILP